MFCPGWEITICNMSHTQAVLYGYGLLRGEEDFFAIIRGTERDPLLCYFGKFHKRHHLKTSAVLATEMGNETLGGDGTKVKWIITDYNGEDSLPMPTVKRFLFQFINPCNPLAFSINSGPCLDTYNNGQLSFKHSADFHFYEFWHIPASYPDDTCFQDICDSPDPPAGLQWFPSWCPGCPPAWTPGYWPCCGGE